MNLRLPTRDEIHRAFLEGEAAVVELFAQVGEQVEVLAQQLETPAATLKEVQARLGKTSANSSKPHPVTAMPSRSGRAVCGNRVKSRWGVSRTAINIAAECMGWLGVRP